MRPEKIPLGSAARQFCLFPPLNLVNIASEEGRCEIQPNTHELRKASILTYLAQGIGRSKSKQCPQETIPSPGIYCKYHSKTGFELRS